MSKSSVDDHVLDAIAGLDQLKDVLHLHHLTLRVPGKIMNVRTTKFFNVITGQMEEKTTVMFKSGKELYTTPTDITSGEFIATCILME